MLTFFLKHKFSIIKFYWLIQFCLFIFVVSSYFLPTQKQNWPQLGHQFADLSVIFFVVSIVPGVLKRLHVSGKFAQLQIILMTFRRQSGIAMFVFGLYHYLFARGFRMLATNKFSLPDSPFEIAGAIALFVALPLFITSNDTAIKFLGKYWKKLHNFTHLIPWAIFLHLLWIQSWGWQNFLIITILVTNLFSWIVSFKRSK